MLERSPIEAHAVTRTAGNWLVEEPVGQPECRRTVLAERRETSMGLTVGHTVVAMRNLERTRDFCARVVGLKQTREVVCTGEHIDRLTGLQAVELKAVILGTAAQPIAVELLWYRSHPPAATPARPPWG